jgi:uncharacterized protein YndB with AHSA1/START domain
VTTSIELTQDIAAPPDRVWSHLEDLASHTTWMRDALRITFTSEQRRGVGVTMSCTTRIGPFTTEDEMTVTRWLEGSEIAVTHRGLVTGTGVFELRETGSGTTLTWREQLRFPWLLGGRIGELIAAPVMRRIWRGNLATFAGICEGA